MSFLVLRGIAKSYGAVKALDGIDLDIERGSRTAVVGASGSGKTTLLRVIAGFEMPDQGTIALDDEVLSAGSSGVAVHKRGIAFVPQDGALFPHLSVAENIGFGLDRAMRGRDERIAELMDLVELDRRMGERAPHQLSGGQQQRVALARGLARKPKLMLLDEPFSALDTGLRESVRRATASVLRAAGVTTILVTHDQAEALSFADQVAVLTHGRVAQAGPPRELYLRPRDRETAEFIGEAIVLTATVSDGKAECAFGHISVVGATESRQAEIMLRPEQLTIFRTKPDGEPAGLAGKVVEIEFGGPSSLVTVLFTGTAGGKEATVTIRVADGDAPEIGERVWVAVLGPAHIFG